jgi:hypothetical protein
MHALRAKQRRRANDDDDARCPTGKEARVVWLAAGPSLASFVVVSVSAGRPG